MVRKREIEQIAEAQNVPKSTIDKDWVLAEKLRALIQRSYTVPRDFYDICYLYKNQKSMDWSEIKSVFHEKMKFKNIEFKGTHQMLNDTTDKRIKAVRQNSLSDQIPERANFANEEVKEYLTSN
jgi:hypothetical protein